MSSNILTVASQDPVTGRWHGRISVYDGDTYLYCVRSTIDRLKAEDAMIDAESLKAEIIAFKPHYKYNPELNFNLKHNLKHNGEKK